MVTSWTDHRLKFVSLHEDHKKNVIVNATDIWSPDIGFVGVINPERDNLGEGDVIITASRDGSEEGKLTGPHELEKNYIFAGETVRITKESTFVGSFYCSFSNISQYPFDTETCSIKMRIMGNDYDFTKLLAANNQWNMSTNYIVIHRKKKHKSFSKGNYVL